MLDALDDPECELATLITASQQGKTDVILNAIGKRVDQRPVPCLTVLPTRNACESQFEPKLDTMLTTTPALAARYRVTGSGRRQGGNRTLKWVGGVPVKLGWAGSATELASFSAGFAAVDEYDRCDPVPGEGDVVDLVRARGTTFADFTCLVASTPTVGTALAERHELTGVLHWRVADETDLQSRTWKRWQDGTREEWAWPCRACGHAFVPRFQHVKWRQSAKDPGTIRATAAMHCPTCDHAHTDADKGWLNAHGAYLAPGQDLDPRTHARRGTRPDNRHRSFWCSGLASPWRTFGDAAVAYTDAVASGDPDRVQAVVNTVLGELFRIRGEAPKVELVLTKREPGFMLGHVPREVRAVTIGVDVQYDRLVVIVRGWSYGLESWLLDYVELTGKTEDPKAVCWQSLDAILARTWGEQGCPVSMCCIDSGFRPTSRPGDKRARTSDHQVYNWARYHAANVRATRGHENQTAPLKVSRIDITQGGRTIRNGLRLVHVNVDFFKSWVHGRLRWPNEELGAFHLPQDTPTQYAEEITAESRSQKASGKVTWVLERKNNHVLDAEALAVAAAYLLGLHKVPVPEDVRAARAPASAEAEAEAPAPAGETYAQGGPTSKPTAPRTPRDQSQPQARPRVTRTAPRVPTGYTVARSNFMGRRRR